MSGFRLLLLLSVMLVPALALSGPAQTNWLDDLRLGGYVIVIRHGATTLDVTADPMSNPNAKRNGPERQLSEAGRAQARSIGEALRKLKIPVGIVMTSPLQRAVDTGTLLAFGDVTPNPDLAEAGSAVSPEENNRRAVALRALVAHHPPADNNLVIVTHKPNFVEAFGKDWSDLREGEAAVFEPDFNGAGYRLIVRLQADQWAPLLKASIDVPEEVAGAPHCLRPLSPHYD